MRDDEFKDIEGGEDEFDLPKKGKKAKKQEDEEDFDGPKKGKGIGRFLGLKLLDDLYQLFFVK